MHSRQPASTLTALLYTHSTCSGICYGGDNGFVYLDLLRLYEGVSGEVKDQAVPVFGEVVMAFYTRGRV